MEHIADEGDQKNRDNSPRKCPNCGLPMIFVLRGRKGTRSYRCEVDHKGSNSNRTDKLNRTETRAYVLSRLKRTVSEPLKQPTTKAIELKCRTCKGTGFAAVVQPAQPGRRIYPARCMKCQGKGRTDQRRIVIVTKSGSPTCHLTADHHHRDASTDTA
jgi:hypothetical protein